MYKLLYIILGAILISCSHSNINNDSPSPIYGEWILVNVSGGFAGDINDIDTITDKQILVITEDNNITYSYNDSLISSTKFHIEKRKSIYAVDDMDFIVYGNKKPPEVIFKLSRDSLGISDNNYDGFSNIYIRRK
jgi:hypothetical protein